jgi:hypothetical protein
MAKVARISGDSQVQTLRKTVQELILKWSNLPERKRNEVMKAALNDARESYIVNYNLIVEDGHHPGMKPLDKSQISDEMMLEGIRQFISTGFLRVPGIPDVMDIFAIIGIVDDFTMPIVDEVE